MFSLFCGVTIVPAQLPKFWRSWMYQVSLVPLTSPNKMVVLTYYDSAQLDPFTRLISGLITTALHDLYIYCEESEFYRFNAPDGQTCEAYAGPFVSRNGGYLDNPNATGECLYCQYRVGDDFYTPLGLSFDDRWRDLGIFIAFIGFNVIVTLVASRYLRYSKR
jgi:ATP-binding cassette subfamily G (WHITE) protein 2 (SNQ2)